MDITLSTVTDAARLRLAAVTAEAAGYLVLLVVQKLANHPCSVTPDGVSLTESGDVSVRPEAPAEPAAVEQQLRRLLAGLVALAPSGTPALQAAAERGSGGDLRALEAELLAALIPINHAAARRALARLYRETQKASPGSSPSSSPLGAGPPSAGTPEVMPTPNDSVFAHPTQVSDEFVQAFATVSPPPVEPAIALGHRDRDADLEIDVDLDDGSVEARSVDDGSVEAGSVEVDVEPVPSGALHSPALAARLEPQMTQSEGTGQMNSPILLADDAATGELLEDAPAPRSAELALAAAIESKEPLTDELLLNQKEPLADEQLLTDEQALDDPVGTRSDLSELLNSFLSHTRCEEKMTEDLRRMLGVDSIPCQAPSHLLDAPELVAHPPL